MDNVKRLNYLVGEDFYFLTYSILVSLETFAPRGSTFKDHRKLSHLVQLITDERLLSVLNRYAERTIENVVDRELLFATYTKGELHKRDIYKLLLAFDKRGYVTLARTGKPEVVDVVLNPEALPEGFISSSELEKERSGAQQLKKIVQRISTMSHETFVERVYASKGLRVWAV